MRPREVMILYLGHVVVLALAGSTVGGVLGALIPVWVSELRPDLIPVTVQGSLSVTLTPLMQGIFIGAAVAFLFSLLPLTRVWQVAPARVLRDEAEPLPIPLRVRLFSMLAVLFGVWGAAHLQSKDWKLSLGFTAGLGSLAAVLWLGARFLHWGVGKFPRRHLPVTVWQGAAALARPGAGTTGSIVTLGLGTLVVLGITLVENALENEIATALPNDAPSLYVWDVQPDQWDRVEELCLANGAGNARAVPVVMARLSAVDGTTVEEILAQERSLRQLPTETSRRESSTEGDSRESTNSSESSQNMQPQRKRWVLTREQRITWMDELSPDNVIVDGELWSDPDVAEMSLEVEFARDLGAKVGSILQFDVQGVPIEFKVTTLREVEWRSFSVNFFLVAEPGVLDDAPGFVLSAIQVPAQHEQQLQDSLTSEFPNVTVIRVRQILDQVTAVLGQIALGIRLLGGFAVVTGLVILIGGIASTQLRRRREAALLKTLGVTRSGVAALFAWEYALTGAVAASLGAMGAYGLTWLFLSEVMEIDAMPSMAITLFAIAGTLLLAVIGGLLASLRALWVRPLQVFREL